MADLDPSSPVAEAAALARAGRLDEAEAAAARHLARDPRDAEALNLLGGIARARGDRGRAERFYADALRCRRDFAKAHSNLGAVLLETGRARDAIAHFREALAAEPGDADARANLGTALQHVGDYAGAERELRAVVAEAPDDALALNSLGTALFHLGRLDEALGLFERALAREPHLTMALNNIATVWRQKGDLGGAERALRSAVAAAPEFAEGWSALGVVLREQGRDREARAAHDRALAIKPSLASARFSRAILSLGEGRLDDGFRDYLARPLADAARLFRRELPASLGGKTIMLLPDQGLGDELFFLRFAPALKRRGAAVLYRAAPAIRSIVARSGTVDRVLAESEPEPGHDLALSIGDLPFALAVRSADQLPPPVALPADGAALAKATETLARLGPPPYIGVTWRAGKRDWNALLKTVPIDALGRALAGLPGTFIVLQRAPEPGEIDALARSLGATAHDLTALNSDLEAMLALLHQIDVYVAVSNTNVHLRAGTPRASHVLVPHPAEWRWMSAGERSPWFPGVPLYRQQATGTPGSGWDEALRSLRRDLAALLSPPAAGAAR